jgi:folylpolyglutamate synthase/dihydropteroate synthase
MNFIVDCLLLQVFTALTFLLFSRENVDIAIVEVSY